MTVLQNQASTFWVLPATALCNKRPQLLWFKIANIYFSYPSRLVNCNSAGPIWTLGYQRTKVCSSHRFHPEAQVISMIMASATTVFANSPVAKIIHQAHSQWGRKDSTQSGRLLKTYMPKNVNICFLFIWILFIKVRRPIIQSTTIIAEGDMRFKAILKLFTKDFIALIWENYLSHLSYASSFFVIPWIIGSQTLASNMIHSSPVTLKLQGVWNGHVAISASSLEELLFDIMISSHFQISRFEICRMSIKRASILNVSHIL